MKRFKTLTKPLIALFVVIVFAWLVVVTRYQYNDANFNKMQYARIVRLTGEIEIRAFSTDKNGKVVDSGWMRLREK